MSSTGSTTAGRRAAPPHRGEEPGSRGEPGEPVLEVRGVVKEFPGARALDDVDFTLRRGEVHALVGENGAGKSTLIKVLTGVHRADEGEVRYRGERVRFTKPSEAQDAGISTIYQEVNLVGLQSVARNVFLGREPRTRLGLVDFRRMNRDAGALLADLGVPVDPTRPLRTLGLGTQQMVALARAVSTDAQVLVMDEPTSSLEPREVEVLFATMDRLHASGVAIVYVSHRMDELYRVCDRVTVMRDGRVVHTGELAGLERLELVRLMLGRSVDARTERSRDDGQTSSDEAPVLEVDGLRSGTSVRDVTFSVAPGEVVGLGGLLGAGRTETVKAVAGALPVDDGQVRVRGSRLRPGRPAGSLRAGVAMLAEDRKTEGIVPGLSVRENIVLAALPRLSPGGLVSRARQDAVVETFVRRLRIKVSSPEQPVSELSGGNQQKVLLARWLATHPTVLLLDEPTRGIDVGAKAEVQGLVDELAAEGLGVVLISSELDELVRGADRVVVLREGAVAGELTGALVREDELMSVIAGAADRDGARACAGAPDGPAGGGTSTGPTTSRTTGGAR
ncbi:sugar ABC transporter ATP-binding protein [Pseudokineococcus basanitobsidens]|uniref:Sugar ABC transporter ATP-binding protein n=1 Tax=Pseudokineococcus basanitobsidens TaxID=1926649 RepID=A0ABU8RHD2_9ACTN